MSRSYDVLVVGSGASAAMAASALVAEGVSTAMLDYGNDNPAGRESIPDKPFDELRRTDDQQADYFIGRHLEGVPRGDVKVGAQLTPPRQFIHADTEGLLSYSSKDFHPMQSLCLGGLAAGWGAACFTYTDAELGRIGIESAGFDRYYNDVAREIGVSGGAPGECDPYGWCGVNESLPLLPLDTNSETVLRRCEVRRARLQRSGFFCGRIPLAVLSRDHEGRRANPLHDMDFYSDSRQSVYRPRYTVDRLRKESCFAYIDRFLVHRFEEKDGGIAVHGIREGKPETISGRRLILCAGAINSARIALNSVGRDGARTSLLCSPYTYIPCVNLAMLGRRAKDERHSLAQLAVFYKDARDPFDVLSIQMYSYRSLLLFKLVKEMPLPAWAGLMVARALMNSFAIFGAFFPDSQGEGKTIRVPQVCADRIPAIQIEYGLSAAAEQHRRDQERGLARVLSSIGCVPVGRIDPGPGSSIHYAGTIPFNNPQSDSCFTRPDYTLAGTRGVYVGDSSSWNWLPAKGLTFTMMANARRIAGLVMKSL